MSVPFQITSDVATERRRVVAIHRIARVTGIDSETLELAITSGTPVSRFRVVALETFTRNEEAIPETAMHEGEHE